jgi:hypothetical protein
MVDGDVVDLSRKDKRAQRKKERRQRSRRALAQTVDLLVDDDDEQQQRQVRLNDLRHELSNLLVKKLWKYHVDRAREKATLDLQAKLRVVDKRRLLETKLVCGLWLWTSSWCIVYTC